MPKMFRNGPEFVEVAQGKPYARCAGGLVADCDQGATATLENFGDLNGQIRCVFVGFDHTLMGIEIIRCVHQACSDGECVVPM